MRITEIPAGFLPHTDDSSRYGYPPGVVHHTVVEVVITSRDGMFLYAPKTALNWGWAIEPASPSMPGLRPCGAPITHYRVVPEVPNAQAN